MDEKDNDYIQVQYLSPRLQPAPTMNQGITRTSISEFTEQHYSAR